MCWPPPNRRAQKEQPATAPAAGARTGRATRRQAERTPAPAPALAHLRGTTQKASRIRQITAKKTRESLQATAQLTQTHEVDMTRIVAIASKDQGRVRRTRGREPDLPAVHRPRRDRRAENSPEHQRQLQRRHPRRSPTTTPSISASPSTPSRACCPPSSTTPATCRWPDWRAPSPTSPPAPARVTCGPTNCPVAPSRSPTSAARARCSTRRSWCRRRPRCWAPGRSSNGPGSSSTKPATNRSACGRSATCR